MSNVLAMDPTVVNVFVPKADKDLPEDQQLKLKYKHLTARQEASLSDQQIKSASKGKKTTYEYAVSLADLKRCEITIVGWTNFRFPADHPDQANQEVPFKVENVGLIPPDVRREFVEFLTKRDKDADDDDDEKDETDLGEAKTE